ncbi:MAG: 16S rRNA (cytidine(1402)-2'-O)-methyltransferase [Calditerrivibrio sp.]|nr:16S rRNA (cytidine(1402)-2'-O)-methyltransferase [Calditerrivibrio sp.]
MLFIVPTPIGNLNDITLRSLEVLKSVDIIYSEDTRNTLKLLNYFEIKKRLLSYHKDNEEKSSDEIITHLKSGKSIALVSDAGTPCISDPGNLLIKKLLTHNINFEVLPGPTAFVPAAIKSGFPTDKIFFTGFLPTKKKDREQYLEYLRNNVIATIVIYEAPHRIISTLEELLQIFIPPISVSRELTKIYETTYYITDTESIKSITAKGEFVIVINNNVDHKKDLQNTSELNRTIEKLKNEGFSNSDILKILKTFGIKRNTAYKSINDFKKKDK